MSINTYEISGPWTGRLTIVARPRGGESLSHDLEQIKGLHFDLLVSLLTAGEAAEFFLGCQSEKSNAVGLEFKSFPIPDLGVPESPIKFHELVDDLNDALEAGKAVAIHCREGIGRSGLLAASLLVASGVNPDAAMTRVSDARGLRVPETDEQRNWVKKFGEEFVDTLAKG